MTQNSASDVAARDRDWAERVRRDDGSAFDELVAAYYPALVNFAYHHLRVRADAEDAVQDVFLQLWRMRSQWEIGAGSVAAYLYRAVRNRAIRMARRSALDDEIGAIVHGEISNVANAGAQAVDAAALQATIDAVFARLPERTREIFLLNRDDGLTYHEVADVLGITFNAVRTQMARTIKALEQALIDWNARAGGR